MRKKIALALTVSILIISIVIIVVVIVTTKKSSQNDYINEEEISSTQYYNYDPRVGEKGIQSNIPQYSDEELKELERRYEEEAAPNIVE